jgi:membrane protein
MNESRPPPSRRPIARSYSQSDHPAEVTVNLGYLSQRWNEALTRFFAASVVHTRGYWLLASLARHNSVRTANAVAFDLFLALVPMLGLAGWAASLIMRKGGDPDAAGVLIRGVTPAQIDAFIGQHFQALAAAHLAPLAALAGWWLVSSAFSTVLNVFEETFECAARSWLETRLVSLAFALGGMILLGVAGGVGALITVAPPGLLVPVLESLESRGLVGTSVAIFSFLGTTSFVALLYRFSIRRPGRTRRVWPGAFLATSLGTAATIGLGYYSTNIAQYALFYGGLAAIVVILLWLWLWSTVILLGAEVNVALEDVARPHWAPEATATASESTQLTADEPVELPTQTPRSAGNSEGD